MVSRELTVHLMLSDTGAHGKGRRKDCDVVVTKGCGDLRPRRVRCAAVGEPAAVAHATTTRRNSGYSRVRCRIRAAAFDFVRRVGRPLAARARTASRKVDRLAPPPPPRAARRPRALRGIHVGERGERGVRRKPDKRAHPPPPAPQNLAPPALAPASGPLPLRRSPAKIAADRSVYAVHSVWPPSIHKKARCGRVAARRRGAALPPTRSRTRRQCGMCQRTKRSFRWSVALALPVFH
ncbi:unnamed protein product, partial [Iphiclides podalirius]